MGKLKIIIAGGSGFIGGALINRLKIEGYAPLVLTRNKKKSHLPGFLFWDGLSKNQSWINELKKAYALINLCGEPIDQLWSNQAKKRIISSRIEPLRLLASALEELRHEERPKIFLGASASGIYPLDNGYYNENSPKGDGFLAEICKQWENAYTPIASLLPTRLGRIGIVLGEEKFLKKATFMFKFFLGGHLGNGSQGLSWIHIDDIVSAFVFLLKSPPKKMEKNPEIYNFTSPNPATNKEFFKTYGQIHHSPSWLHIPKFPLKLFLGNFATELLLSGHFVFPNALESLNYRFDYPQLNKAIKSLKKPFTL